jgi:NAD(P) transhydrogenase
LLFLYFPSFWHTDWVVCQLEQVKYEIGICKFSETAKGAMLGYHNADAGMLKLLFDPTTHRLLGVHVIGESASELVHIGQVVMSLNASIEYFRDNVFNYPTFAESYRIAAIDGLNRLASHSACQAPASITKKEL